MTKLSIQRVLAYLLLIGFGILFLYPFLFMTFSSFKPQSEIFTDKQLLLPQEDWRIANYAELFERTTFARGLLNSAFVAGVYVALSVLLCALGGFAFAKYAFPGRRPAFVFMLLTMMVPQGVMMVPLFQIVSWLGWVNTYLPLIIPGLANAFGIFFMRQYASSLPDSLLDAARIDGCSEFGLFWRIVLPVLTPGLMVLACLFFMNSWNDFLWPLVVLNKREMYTVPIILASFVRGEGDRYVAFGTIFAGSTMGAIPVVTAFLLFQRQFIAGILAGSVK